MSGSGIKQKIYKDLVLTSLEFEKMYEKSSRSFTKDYFVHLKKFVLEKLKFSATANKKENLPNSITFQMKCASCFKLASATVKRHKIDDENITLDFKSSCSHFGGMLYYYVFLFHIFKNIFYNFRTSC